MSQDQKQLDEKLEIYIPNGPRLGTNVIEATGVSKAYGDKLLYENLNFNLPQAGIVGIIGPNGAGKTTLFKMIKLTKILLANTLTSAKARLTLVMACVRLTHLNSKLKTLPLQVIQRQ
mgnify:CR=1 FL=1